MNLGAEQEDGIQRSFGNYKKAKGLNGSRIGKISIKNTVQVVFYSGNKLINRSLFKEG